MGIGGGIVGLESEMTVWRHHLHAHPETAFQEWETSDFLAEKLGSFGLDVHRGIGRTGIVATLVRGHGHRGAIGLRADMDALNIQEENDLAYKSTVSGKMHACGHDGHMAMLLGAAKHLASDGRFSGTVNFIFQPAEETAGGAKTMLDDGLFQRFPVDSVFGLHNFPTLPEGSFATRSGILMAAFDTFDITIKGIGGHAGGMPPNLRDPLVAASHAVVMFQSIVSRNIEPTDAAVLSVTEIKGGMSYNVIPDNVLLRGCSRHLQPHVQDIVETRMKEVLNGLEISMGVSTDIRYQRECPAVINSTEETQAAVQAASVIAGSDNVYTDISPVMGSDDFALMLESVPGTYMVIGAGVPRANGTLHQPGFNFNDRILSVGAGYWITLVESLLPEK
ncbi:MAG TPA: M20 aminoacylase family protein [Desulfomonilaceae bacterium]|nr:M20 aminoacylase family protein [Desulfomonilaceae bacterium]